MNRTWNNFPRVRRKHHGGCFIVSSEERVSYAKIAMEELSGEILRGLT